MATLQTKKQSDLEKRLQLLRRQVYGKNAAIYQHTNHQTSTNLIQSDIIYLYQDLSKIGILASLAIGVQLILFVLKFF